MIYRMRNLLYLILFTAFALTACSKGEKVCCDAPEDNTIFMRAQKADTTWQAGRTGLIFYEDSVAIYGTNKEEHLIINIKPTGIGRYPITPQNGVFTLTTGGDVTSAEYRATASSSNYINITRYDATRGFAEGEFSATFVINPRYASSGLDNEVSFIEGKFRVDIPYQ